MVPERGVRAPMFRPENSPRDQRRGAFTFIGQDAFYWRSPVPGKSPLHKARRRNILE